MDSEIRNRNTALYIIILINLNSDNFFKFSYRIIEMMYGVFLLFLSGLEK